MPHSVSPEASPRTLDGDILPDAPPVHKDNSDAANDPESPVAKQIQPTVNLDDFFDEDADEDDNVLKSSSFSRTVGSSPPPVDTL